MNDNHRDHTFGCRDDFDPGKLLGDRKIITGRTQTYFGTEQGRNGRNAGA